MGIFLNSNVAAINAGRNLTSTTALLTKSLERLSSGYKINRASDGAGSLVASEMLRGRIRGTDVAMTNVQQGISILNIADGALSQVYGHLERLSEIAVEASNGTVTDFTAYNSEITEIVNAIDAISNGTGYEALVLLDGSIANLAIQSGPTANATDQIDIAGAFQDTDTAALGVTTTTLATNADAQTLLGEVEAAMSTLGGFVATIGGFQNQLESRMEVLGVMRENLTASEASLRNTDVAYESSRMTQLQIMQQASALALAQANQIPSIALSLLR